jgi:hypothetical protein
MRGIQIFDTLITYNLEVMNTNTCIKKQLLSEYCKTFSKNLNHGQNASWKYTANKIITVKNSEHICFDFNNEIDDVS